MICEKARNAHSNKLWKLHESMQNNPDLKMRDPAMVKKLIAWEKHLWNVPGYSQDSIETIEGSITLEQLGEKWNTMEKGQRGLLLRQVNLEEHLLGNTSLPKPISPGSIYHSDDKYHNDTNLKKDWDMFSDEDKEKIHRAYTWSFSYTYYDEEKGRNVMYSKAFEQFQAHEELFQKDEAAGGTLGALSYPVIPCQECGLEMGNVEVKNIDILGEMCLKCFREQTEQTHYWYDIPPVLKGKQCAVCSISFFGRSDSDKCGKHREEGVIFDPDWRIKKLAAEDKQ